MVSFKSFAKWGSFTEYVLSDKEVEDSTSKTKAQHVLLVCLISDKEAQDSIGPSSMRPFFPFDIPLHVAMPRFPLVSLGVSFGYVLHRLFVLGNGHGIAVPLFVCS